MGGLIVLLLLGAVGIWYLVGIEKHSSPALASVTPTNSFANTLVKTAAQETPQETPEGVPEEQPQGTPAPGFTDDFDNRLGPAWIVLYGDPFIANGQLTSNLGAGIAAGDASWEN